MVKLTLLLLSKIALGKQHACILPDWWPQIKSAILYGTIRRPSWVSLKYDDMEVDWNCCGLCHS
jgi:hypothetical protein